MKKSSPGKEDSVFSACADKLSENAKEKTHNKIKNDLIILNLYMNKCIQTFI